MKKLMAMVMMMSALLLVCGCGEKSSNGQSKDNKTQLTAQKQTVINDLHKTLNAMNMPDAWQNNLINNGKWGSSDDEFGANLILMDHKALFEKYVELKEILSKINDELEK